MSEPTGRFSVRFKAGNARYEPGNILNPGDVLRGPENRSSERRLRGGERGIRTLDTLLTYTHFPGVRLQPLGHLSDFLIRPQAGAYATARAS